MAGLHYIPSHWPPALQERVEEAWSRRRYRLRMIAEGRWSSRHAAGACHAVYYGSPSC